MTYAQKLLDPRWQRKRLEIFQRDDFTCQCCGASDKTLHVHHEQYIYGNSPWDYPNTLLKTLCSNCHRAEHLDELEISKREDAITITREWKFIGMYRFCPSLLEAQMVINGSYDSHRLVLSKIRQQISERNKPVING